MKNIKMPPYAYYLAERRCFFMSQNSGGLMDGFNKAQVMDKLKEIGMGDIARKLDSLSEKEIENMLRSNPAILKKAREIMKGGK